MRALASALIVALAVAAGATAAADSRSVPSTAPALDKRLATYDPKAVAAAKHYYTQPAIKAGMNAMVDNIEKAMAQQIARQNPSTNPQQLAKLQTIAGDVLKERLDLILEMSMVNALDILSTDEIVALDAFYSSPTGAKILEKMPQISAALPAMMKSLMPDYLAEVKAKMKASGADLKL